MPTDQRGRESPKSPILTEKDLCAIWKQKFRFNKKVLGLSDQKAVAWANRTIRTIRETVTESGGYIT